MQHPQKICEAGEVCDFCSATPVAKIYDAAPIALRLCFAPPMVHVCDTKWTSCTTCADFIDQDRWTDLTDRSIETWLAKQRSHGVHIGDRSKRRPSREMGCMHASFRGAMSRTA